jgi:hypothetical protein
MTIGGTYDPKKKDDRPEKHGKQGADLGQKEAALEKEKEAEMHHMGKGQPSPTTGKTRDTQARSPGTS